MPIIQLIIVLAIIGVIMWLINTYLPMAEPWKKILNIVVIVATVLWLLSVFGVFSMGGSIGGAHTRIGTIFALLR
jgi:uncharacterized BrkB/YihY/UPF0761 family membrane protein